MFKIIVQTEEQKERILKESKYIHDFLEVVQSKTKDGNNEELYIGLDSDKAGMLMHIYMNPDMIVVNGNV